MFTEKNYFALNEAVHSDPQTFEHTVHTPTNIWNNPTLYQSIHKNGINKFVYQKKFKILAEKMSLETKKHGLLLSETQKDATIKKAFEFFKYLKLVFKSPRVSLKSCFVVASYYQIKAELDSDLVDFDFVAAFFYEDLHFKKRILGLYLNLYRKNFAEKSRLTFENKIQELTFLFVDKFFSETENFNGKENASKKSEELVKRILRFSGHLTGELESRKIKNVAAALAFLVVTVSFGIGVNVKEFFVILQRETEFVKGDNSGLQLGQAKLFGSVCYNSVTHVHLRILKHFMGFFEENILKKLERTELIGKFGSKVKEDVLLISANRSNLGSLKRNFLILVRVCWAFKKLDKEVQVK